MKGRALSLILAVVLMLSAFSYSASAADGGQGAAGTTCEKATFGGHTYQLILYPDGGDWNTVKSDFERLGGHLATITSAEEDAFLFGYMKSCGQSSAYFGLTDEAEEGNWAWVTGEPCSYTNWAPGEGNNQGGYEDYGMYYHKFSNGKWNDGSGLGTAYLCEWDFVQEEEPEGFWPDRDGWSFANIQEAFGYPDSYRIPASRYYEVFGYNLTSLIFSGLKQLPAWGGSCYGMSILAAAQYNGQLDLTVLFPSSGQGLYQFGQSGIATAGEEQYFQIAENPDAVATVERAHLIQHSQEIKKAEVFGWDKSYSQLLAYLNEENTRPLLISLSNGMGGHIVVTDTTKRPEKLTGAYDGWYDIYLYDSNAPSNSEQLSNPRWYYQQSQSILRLNTANGDWRYYRNGQLQMSGNYSLLWEYYIKFYDISLLGNIFHENAFTLLGTLIKLDFSASDLEVQDHQGQTVFKVQDNQITYLSENCVFTPRFDQDGGTGILTGSLEIDSSTVTCVSGADSELMLWNDGYLLSIAAGGEKKIELNALQGKVTVQALEQGPLTATAQKGVVKDSIAMQIQRDMRQGERLQIHLDADGMGYVDSSEGDATADISLENDSGMPEKYEDVTIEEIREIDGNRKVISFHETYTIHASAGKGGRISPSGEVSVAGGASQSFRISADKGYRISQVLVDGIDIGAVDSYTFHEVEKDHQITAVFQKVPADSFGQGSTTGSNGGQTGQSGSGQGGKKNPDTGAVSNL